MLAHHVVVVPAAKMLPVVEPRVHLCVQGTELAQCRDCSLILRRIGSDFARTRAYHGAKPTGKKLEMRTCMDIVAFLQSSTGTLRNNCSSLPVLRVQAKTAHCANATRRLFRLRAVRDVTLRKDVYRKSLLRMSSTVKTYSMLERLKRPDFGIHDARVLTNVERLHRHEYFQVQLHVEGTAEHRVGARLLSLGPGSLCFVLPYRLHRAGRFPGSRFIIINFDHRFLRPTLDIDPLDVEDVPLAVAPEFAPFLFQEHMDFRLDGEDFEIAQRACRIMAEEDRRRGYCSLEIIHAQLIILLTTVCRRYERKLLDLAAGQVQIKSRGESLSRVLRYVRDNIQKRITLTEAAEAAHLSADYLTHLLKKETGKTFTELVTARRMEKARELLGQTQLRIAEIAAAVGFEDEAYFARRFKQYFERSPREYRKRGI